MSVSHSRSGAAAVNARLTRSSSVGGVDQVAAAPAPVGALHPGLAHEPLDAFAVHRQTQASVSSAWTRGEP